MQSVTKTLAQILDQSCQIVLFGTFLLLSIFTAVESNGQESLISDASNPKGFCLFNKETATPIYIDNDYPGVRIAVSNLKMDIGKVCGHEPRILERETPTNSNDIIITGTLGRNQIIDDLVKSNKISVTLIKDKWEAYMFQVVENPLPNVKRALLIIGSDKRGTIFGIYELSKLIGVSPWNWWADVPSQRHQALYFKADTTVTDKPAVKYRGIFLNDEEPALGRWAVEKFGGFNHQFYEKLFELMLRLKANYLWPAMWWASFNSDDPSNPKLADDYGIVMGTTHHEPMMRAHAEWKKINGGDWNYETNESKLNEFWREGIQRMNSYESIVTLAMRGDGDKAMTAETNTALLERIVKNQRNIIKEVTKKNPEEVPQLWALYKEVQDYYDKGMRVPDDVLLLLCDDNWGNIRKLPKVSDPKRKGGYGIYYHFDYVGDPRNYKWVNTNPLPRIWEQMNLAYQYGANQLWLVNVGDLKPMEFPTEFFLDFAWYPDRIKADNLKKYSIRWASEQFGRDHAEEIASLLNQYSKFNARRKPELLSSETYSLLHYHEAETIVSDYNNLVSVAERVNKVLPVNHQDAFFELVLHPIKASANLNNLYLMQAKNKYYATQGRASTNKYADSVKILFKKDSTISHFYNKELLNGKWNHMMDQTHISYTYWQQPEKDVTPQTTEIKLTEDLPPGIAPEGSAEWWPQAKSVELPIFDSFNKQQYFIELFRRGNKIPSIAISTTVDWIKTSLNNLSLNDDSRLYVNIDWKKVPVGKSQAYINITSGREKGSVKVIVDNSLLPEAHGFIESNGYVSIESVHYTKALNSSTISWLTLPDLGRTNSSITTIPVTAPSQTPGGANPKLEYSIYTSSTGDVTLYTYLSPTIDFHNEGGLKFAISIDDESPKIVNMHSDKSYSTWEKSVSDNIIICSTKHQIKNPGQHTIKYWVVDSGVVLQKLVVDTGGLKPSYLGPPESFFKK